MNLCGFKPVAVYIYRQAILLRGVLWFPPQKVVSLKKGRVKKEERKRKEKGKNRKKRREQNRKQHLERNGKIKRKRGVKVTEKTANYGREETKFASCDIPIKYEITLENGEI